MLISILGLWGANQQKPSGSFSERLNAIHFPESNIPDKYIDEYLTSTIMEKPIKLDEHHIIDAVALEQWWESHPDKRGINPVTNEKIMTQELCLNLHREIEQFVRRQETLYKQHQDVCAQLKKYIEIPQREIFARLAEVEHDLAKFNEALNGADEESFENIYQRVVDLHEEKSQLEYVLLKQSIVELSERLIEDMCQLAGDQAQLDGDLVKQRELLIMQLDKMRQAEQSRAVYDFKKVMICMALPENDNRQIYRMR